MFKELLLTVLVASSVLLKTVPVQVTSSVEIPQRVTQLSSTTRFSPSLSRDVFYLSDRFGFRFVLPKGHTLTPSEQTPSRQPNPPIQVLELWQQGDFLNRTSLPEMPPIIRITVYQNSPQLPLISWKGELSHKDDRTVKVAGQSAIAYTSTGLYESDNLLFRSPDNRYVLRLQGSYLKADDSIRKVFQEVVANFAFDVLTDRNNQKKINYSRLQSLLTAKNWQGADVETRAILQRLHLMSGATGSLLFDSKSVLKNLPCEDLRTLDNLWTQASQGRFGYRVQQRLWQQTASVKNPKARVERFGQLVGWRSPKPLPNDNPIAMELGGIQWRLDPDLNYTSNAPTGQFPWIGLSSSLLVDYLSERSLGCGSCTIDALYLAGDRYYDSIPAMLNQLGQCKLNSNP